MFHFKKLLASCLLLLALAPLTSCGATPATSAESATNVYAGGGSDFHLHGWDPSDFNAMSISENGDASTSFDYSKSSGTEYLYASTSLSGDLADFDYINLKVTGAAGHAIRVRIATSIETIESNIIGGEYDLALQSEPTCYSLKIKGVYQTRLDLAKAIALYPDIAHSGIDYYNQSFKVWDCFFSSSVPTNYTWANQGIDSGDPDEVVINGWKCSSWTNYTIASYGSEVSIYSAEAADWASISKAISFTAEQNYLDFGFINASSTGSDHNQTTRMTIKLRGDKQRYVSDVEYPYWLYYEETIYNYRFGVEGEAVEDSAGLISLHIPVSAALSSLAEHSSEGLSVLLLVESDLNEWGSAASHTYDGYVNMCVKSMTPVNGTPVLTTPWKCEAWTGYTITALTSGSEIVYSSVASDSYAYCYAEIDPTDKTTLTLPLENKDLSVDSIAIILRGDKDTYVDSGSTGYWLYHQETIFEYKVADYTTPVSTLSIPLSSALTALADFHKDGFSLVLQIESNPTLKSASYDGKGDLILGNWSLA